MKFAGLIHPGILGCAPSAEVLATWNKREGELIAASKLEGRDVALPPLPQSAHAGAADASVAEQVGREGARTVPGRPEHGGNCDIKNLSRGSKVYLPVHVAGAKFSVGDLHFSQGDGEISFCGAIEMAGVITIKLKVLKNGVADLGMKSPIYIPGPVEPQFGPGRYIYFEGFSVDEHGKQHYMDVTVAYRQTTLREYPAAVSSLSRRFPGDTHADSGRQASSNTSAASDTATTRSTSCCRARPSRATLPASSTSRTRVPRSGCRSTFLTLTSRLPGPRRSSTWAPVCSRVVPRRARSRRAGRTASTATVAG